MGHDHRRTKSNEALMVAWRVQTPRLVLRCLAPDDAPALVEAITCSLDSLRPWMLWARTEPQSVAEKAQLIWRWRNQFSMGLNLHYGLFTLPESTIIGVMGMHARVGAGARELGYWIRADAQRRGIASETAMALTRLGFEHMRLRRMEIHCDPKNIASSGVARCAGYQLQTEIRSLIRSRLAPQRDGQLWHMNATIHQRSPAARLPLQAFNEFGERVFSSSPG